MHYSALQYNTVQYNTVYNKVQYSTTPLRHNTVLYTWVQYSTTQTMRLIFIRRHKNSRPCLGVATEALCQSVWVYITTVKDWFYASSLTWRLRSTAELCPGRYLRLMKQQERRRTVRFPCAHLKWRGFDVVDESITCDWCRAASAPDQNNAARQRNRPWMLSGQFCALYSQPMRGSSAATGKRYLSTTVLLLASLQWLFLETIWLIKIFSADVF